MEEIRKLSQEKFSSTVNVNANVNMNEGNSSNAFTVRKQAKVRVKNSLKNK